MTALDIKNENSIFTTAGLYKTRIETISSAEVPISDSGEIRDTVGIITYVKSFDPDAYTPNQVNAIRHMIENMVDYGLTKYHGGTVVDVAAESNDYGACVHIDIDPPIGCIYTGLCIEVQTARNPGPVWTTTGMHFRAKVKGTKSRTRAKSTWRIISGGDYMKEVVE